MPKKIKDSLITKIKQWAEISSMEMYDKFDMDDPKYAKKVRNLVLDIQFEAEAEIRNLGV